MSRPVPHDRDTPFTQLVEDPYPCFERLRRRAPIVWVENANIHLVVDFETILEIERNPEVFAAQNPLSLQTKVMGHSLMRKDGAAHQIERKALNHTFNPSTVQKYWKPKFARISNQLIKALSPAHETDLFHSYAAPMASLCLLEVLGFKDIGWETLALWSQSLMDGVANYSGDSAIAKRAKQASDGIDTAIDAVIADKTSNPDRTVISAIANAQPPHSLEQLRANVKVIIGGGLNEPRDAILSAVFGLLSNPAQLQAVLSGSIATERVFEEAVRWISPIGMYPRLVTKDVTLSGMALKKGMQLGLCVGAANRDENLFERPNTFDVTRPKKQHLAFGSGAHFCAGTWMSRAMVGQVALPQLLSRLQGLKLSTKDRAQVRGWVFRGPVTLPIEWTDICQGDLK